MFCGNPVSCAQIEAKNSLFDTKLPGIGFLYGLYFWLFFVSFCPFWYYFTDISPFFTVEMCFLIRNYRENSLFLWKKTPLPLSFATTLPIESARVSRYRLIFPLSISLFWYAITEGKGAGLLLKSTFWYDITDILPVFVENGFVEGSFLLRNYR